MHSLHEKIALYNNQQKWRIFNRCFQFDETTRILDVGFIDKEISIVSNYIEKHYAHPHNITALGVEQPVEFSKKYPAVKTVIYDGKRFPFEDESFDICWTNTVWEHVGNRQRQLLFIKEINRVAKGAFISTPNRFFPVEVHTHTPFIHYLPKKYFDKYLQMTGQGWAAGDFMNLLSYRDAKNILDDAGIIGYKIMSTKLFFLPLHFIIIWGGCIKY